MYGDQTNSGSGYGGSGYGGYDDRPAPKNGLAVVALVLAIIGFLLGFVLIGLVPAVIGLILGIVGLRRVRRGLATNRGVALTAVVISLIAIIGTLIWGAIVAIGFGGAWNNGGREAWECLQNAETQVEVDACTRQLEDSMQS